VPSLDEIKESLRKQTAEELPSKVAKPLASPHLEEKSPKSPESYAKAEIMDEAEKEAAALDASRRKKKRTSAALKDENIDWEEQEQEHDDEESDGVPWFLVGSVFLAVVLVVGLGAFYLRNFSLSDQGGMSVGGTLEKFDASLPQSTETDEAAAKMIEQFETFDLEAVLKAVKGFLSSETIAERSQFSREGERVLPLMAKYYGGTEIEKEGFRKLDQTEISYRGQLLSSFVQIKDFSWSPIVIERTEKGYLIDWESWVGYGEMTLEQMMREKPTDPIQVRAFLTEVSYYNFGFSDDEKWASFRLAFFEEDQRLWAYVKRNTALEERLSSAAKDGAQVPGVFLLKYPDRTRTNDQVILTEMLTSGWVLPSEESK